MDKQKITVALPRDVLQRLEVMAAQRERPISAILEEMLRDALARHEGYEQARRRQSSLLARGLDFGTRGKASWTRDQLRTRWRTGFVPLSYPKLPRRTFRNYRFSTSNCIYTGMPLARYELMLDVWRAEGSYP